MLTINLSTVSSGLGFQAGTRFRSKNQRFLCSLFEQVFNERVCLGKGKLINYSLFMPITKSKQPCCISQSKGIQIIVIVSCIFGFCIILLCIPILVNDQNKKEQYILRISEGEQTRSEIILPDQSVYLKRKIAALAIVQILSSLCLLNSKRFKAFAPVWIIFQTITVVIVLVFLWNLPLRSDPHIQETKLQRFSRHLFTVLGVNVCLTIFLILILVEFIMHPEKKTKQGELDDEIA